MSRSLIFIVAVFLILNSCGDTQLIDAPSEGEIDEATYSIVENDLSLIIDQQLPEDLVNNLAQSEVVVFGETHYVQEHQEFLVSILPQLSELGYNYVFDELFHAFSWVVQDYVNGERDEIPEFIRFFNQELIEGIKAFNATVDDDHKMNLVYFDINHWRDNFTKALDLVELEIGDQPIFEEIFMQTANSSAYIMALGSLQEILSDQEANYRTEWGDLWYDRLVDMLEVELVSVQFRNARDDRAREEKMFDNLMTYVDFNTSSKYLVNTGMSHAQKNNYMSNSTTRIGAMLANITDNLHTMSFIGLSGERKFRFYDTDHLAFDLSQSVSTNDMTKYLAEFSANQMSYLPLSDDHFSANLQKISYSEGTTIFAHVGRQFDAIVCYPSISILDSMDEFDWQ